QASGLAHREDRGNVAAPAARRAQCLAEAEAVQLRYRLAARGDAGSSSPGRRIHNNAIGKVNSNGSAARVKRPACQPNWAISLASSGGSTTAISPVQIGRAHV